MKTSRSLYYWFALFALCFITYQQVIDNIRPNYIGNNLTVKYLLGIAPNFFPAIGIPALFVVLIPQMKQTSLWDMVERKKAHRSKFNFSSRTSILGVYSSIVNKIKF